MRNTIKREPNMRVNSVNNNYNNQRQQNFGAIAGKNFEEGLVRYLANLRPDVLQETLTLLNTPKAVSEFVGAFRDVKVKKTGFHGALSPVFDICNFDNKHFYIEGILNGERLGGGEIKSQPGTNLFNMILTRVKTALGGYQLTSRTLCEPYSDVPTNKSIRESVHDLVELLNKNNTDTAVEIL